MLAFVLLGFFQESMAQDTTVISTLNYNSATRDTVIDFPDGSESYRKVLMLYNMRCKGARVSNSGNRNLGCGEWDYSCNTYITDSTRVDSFLYNTSEYRISNYTGTSFDYYSNPLYHIYRSYNKTITNTAINSESMYSVGSGTADKPDLINPAVTGGKTLLIYTAQELLGAGLTPGLLDALTFNSNSTSTIENLRIRMQNGNADSITSEVALDNLQEVYANTVNLTSGINRFNFHQPFMWDGTSNIYIEIYYNAFTGTIPTFKSDVLTVNRAAHSISGNYLYLNGSTYVETNNYKGIMGTADRSIDAWVKTTTTNGEICSWGTDRAGEKWVFRINDNGAIRVEVNGGNVIGSTLVNDNQWHHVACVFSGTSVSDITLYVDGEAEVIGSIANRTINTTSGINLRMSRGVNNRYFNGEMDELKVWDKALSATEVAYQYRLKSIPSQVNYTNLVLYYDFEGNTNVISDESSNNNGAKIIGDVAYRSFLAKNNYKDFMLSSMRPNIQFFRGDYVQMRDSTAVFDSIQQIPHFVERYSIVPKPNTLQWDSIATIEQNTYWNANSKHYYFDQNDNVYDSLAVVKEGTITNNVSLPYYRRYPSSLEIMSFVTPYGIGLDLGVDGKTWVFDVTDFVPILKNKRRMFMSRGGQWQEEMDIKFLFIKGTPEREVKNISQIWPTSFVSANYNQILANTNYFPPVKYPVNNETYKIRSAITGHGQQGEFIPRNHSIIAEGKTFTQRVWKECAENPVYPQGGTWIYDRAGWCPGMATDVAEYDVTELAKGKDEITIDYTIDAGEGDSRYIINNQIVTYGPWKNKLDASVTDIISPSSRVEYQRTNPACVNPTIKISNTGSDTLKFVKVEYWVNDKSNSKTNVWHGTLLPGKETIHPLPVEQDIWLSATGNNDRFYASIVEVNGAADQNISNDLAVSNFELPDLLPNHIVLFMRGNAAGPETSVKITDDWGQVIYNLPAMENNKNYRDTIRLGSGCHKLSVKDSDDDGISFWANQDGSGYVRILKVGGGYNKTLQGDHGDGIEFNFTVNNQLSVRQSDQSSLVSCYPNPSNGLVYLDGTGLEQAQITVYNNLGQMVSPRLVQSIDNANLDFSNLPVGFYSISIQIGDNIETKKVIIY